MDYSRFDAIELSSEEEEEEEEKRLICERRAAHDAVRRAMESRKRGDAREDIFGLGAGHHGEDVVSLREYAWEDGEREVRVCVELPEEDMSIISSGFRTQSLNVELRGTRRYRFAVAELSMEIRPNQSECFIDEYGRRLVCKIVKFGKCPWSVLARM